MKAIKEFFKGDQFAARNNIEPSRGRKRLCQGEDDIASASLERLGHCPWRGHFHAGGLCVCRRLQFARDGSSGAEREHHLHESRHHRHALGEAREVSKNFKVGAYAIEIKDDQGELVAQFQGLAYRKKDRLPFAPPEKK